MVRRVVVFLLFTVCTLPELLHAQPTSGTQDSVLAGELRPRRGTHIIVPFPSPAHRGVTMTLQYYNYDEERTSFRVVDINDRTIMVLQSEEVAPVGVHPFYFNTSMVATGTYFVRLTRYGIDGSQIEVQNLRFIVVH